MHTKDMPANASRNALPVVLLIDDDMVSREVTAAMLGLSGYTVQTAEGGDAALLLLTPADGQPAMLVPGAILMDAQMPGISGTELIAGLRARTQARIFVVSGSYPPSDVMTAADGFLLKPFSAEALGKLLEGSEQQPAPSLLDASDPVVSEEILSQFRKLMPEPAVRQVYEAVVADLGRRIEALAAAMARGDNAEVRRIGHAIKGGCGMAGAMEAARLGAMLELGDNQLDNSRILLEDLRVAARRLQTMLDAEMPA